MRPIRKRESPPPGMPEKTFMAEVIRFATMLGYRCWHQHDSRRSRAGWPDLVAVRGKVILFMELKGERGRLRPEQEECLSLLREAGQRVFVFRPSQMEEIIALLRRA